MTTRHARAPLPQLFVLETRRAAMAMIEQEVQGVDESGVEEFLGRTLGDTAAAMTTAFCVIGDRLGLFEALTGGPATSADLAERTGLNERYVREWATGLTAAGYLTFEPGPGRFALPPEHAVVLTDRTSPMYLGGLYGMIGGLLGMLEPVTEAFRGGGGVALTAYDEHFWGGVERLTGATFGTLLVPVMVPSVDGLAARLEQGADVADVGCGAGIALITLADAYPNSRFHGFDLLGANIERARRAARASGVDDRVTFTQVDAVDGVPGTYDVITIFDVVHDSADPQGLLRAVRAAVRDDGIVTVLDINCADAPGGNVGPVAAVAYGFSLFHCMTQSLAAGGAGLGTCGVPEGTMRALARAAGFLSVTRRYEGPFDVLYEVRP